MAQNSNDLRSKDDAGIRILATFGITLFALASLLLCYKFYMRGNSIYSVYLAAVAVQWSGLGVFAVFGALWFWKRKNWLLRLSLAGAALCVCGYITAHHYLAGVKLLCVLVAGIAVLYLVWLIYRRELFTVALVIAAAALSTWLRMAGYPSAWAVFGLALALDILMAAGLLLCRRNRGTLELGKKSFVLFGKRVPYLPMLISCGLSAAVLFAGLFGYAACYFSMFVLVAAAFVYAVYYTVKLM